MTRSPALPLFTAEQLREYAYGLGFIACGVTDLSPTPHGDALDRWIREGRGGVMRYLNRQAKKRKDPSRIDHRARSAVVILDSYYYSEPSAAKRFKVARYARGQDYHLTTMRRLEVLADWMVEHGATWARPFADAGPVPERELAQRAGLGWIGKNTMLLRPGTGSWFVIGCVLSDLALPADEPFTADHCGSCTRCLDACPTGAFVEPRVLDATRCLSYQSIEHKGAIPADIAARMDGWIFGCDICNEVCPWNERFAADSSIPEFRPRLPVDLDDPECFARLTRMEFEELFADSALLRPGLEKLRRNVRSAVEGQLSKDDGPRTTP